ncbi:hypothetical protein BJ546DRAFT_241478 [Cryomyces antarcticus]
MQQKERLNGQVLPPNGPASPLNNRGTTDCLARQTRQGVAATKSRQRQNRHAQRKALAEKRKGSAKEKDPTQYPEDKDRTLRQPYTMHLSLSSSREGKLFPGEGSKGDARYRSAKLRRLRRSRHKPPEPRAERWAKGERSGTGSSSANRRSPQPGSVDAAGRESRGREMCAQASEQSYPTCPVRKQRGHRASSPLRNYPHPHRIPRGQPGKPRAGAGKREGGGSVGEGDGIGVAPVEDREGWGCEYRVIP